MSLLTLSRKLCRNVCEALLAELHIVTPSKKAISQRHYEGLPRRGEEGVYPRLKHGAGSEALEGLTMTKRDFDRVSLVGMRRKGFCMEKGERKFREIIRNHKKLDYFL